MKIAVFPNYNNEGVKELSKDIEKELSKLDVTYTVFDYYSIEHNVALDSINNSDFVIAVGGDGTTLNIAKLCAECDKPVLGINAGRLGFMSGLEKNELNLLSNLVTDDYEIEERMMLSAIVNDKRYDCLNDAVITRGDRARLIDITVSCDGRQVTTSRADGMIFSTPTGSTAYSMAAGGPVLSPDNQCYVVTPICPHSLVNRSIVFTSNNVLEVYVNSDKNNNSYLSLDGGESILIEANNPVTILKSDLTAKLVKLKPDNFYEILNKKIIERRN